MPTRKNLISIYVEKKEDELEYSLLCNHLTEDDLEGIRKVVMSAVNERSKLTYILFRCMADFIIKNRIPKTMLETLLSELIVKDDESSESEEEKEDSPKKNVKPFSLVIRPDSKVKS